MKWTDKQEQVIKTRGRNILVSAAAGSGKTAVLVERIIQKVMDSNNPIDVDRLLVVTFTKAAASEMRQRVLEALEEVAKLDPDNEHLQKQQTYIHNAQITTIDSFCARIVREHFDKIDLDPNTKIIDEAEMQMIQSDVIGKLLEEKYEEQEKGFIALSDRYTDPKNTDNLSTLVASLYKTSMSYIQPIQWLEECRRPYNISGEQDVLESEWFLHNIKTIAASLAECSQQLEMGYEICLTDDSIYNYGEYLKSVKEDIDEAIIIIIPEFKEGVDFDGSIDLDTFNRFRETLLSVSFPTAPRLKNVDESLKNRIVGIRDKVKKELQKIKDTYFAQGIDEITSDIMASKEMVDALVDLTIQFHQRFHAEKNDKCVMDFADQEHYALEILVEIEDDGSFVPTDVAKELAVQYEEIMIDEYQDSNYVQEAILTSVSRGQGINNVFMVGDVKQSIYKFRLANPNLFIDKYDTYSEDEDAPERKIILDKNFRSRKEIINSVNYVFRNLMHRDLGGIEYDSDNELVLGADYLDVPEGQDNSTEFIIVDKNGNENEVRAIAERIKQLVDPAGNFKIQKDNEFVTPKYRDIVILLRGIKNRGDEYVKYLEQEGIPAYCESKTGYYDAKEVRTILDFLKIIDNPYQDIPLASVLRSAMFKFSSEELARIRLVKGEGYLLGSMKEYMVSAKDTELALKIENFIKLLCEYRAMVPYTSVYDFITRICNDTGYIFYINSMPGGKRRGKNIEILKEKAATYDEGAYRGLFNFVRYIDKIKELEMDEGEASVVNENDNIVRIMTIHKSKGLQFPIVFISALDTKFNSKNACETLLAHDKWHLGIDYIDSKLKVKKPTAIKTMIGNIIKEEEYAENIRLLYVAMTRAKEKMILTASLKNAEKTINEWLDSRRVDENVVPYATLMDKNKFSQWLGYAIVKNKGFDNVIRKIGGADVVFTSRYNDNSDISAYYVSEDELTIAEIESDITNALDKEQLQNWDGSIIYDEQLKELIESKLDWAYEFKDAVNIPAKASVTELKVMFGHSEDEEADNSIGRPEKKYKEVVELTFNKPTGTKNLFTGAKLGTAYHRIFELFDMEMEPTRDNIASMLDRYVREGKITKLTRDSVDINKFVAFSKSSLYKRMKEAYMRNELFRERAFLMGVKAKDIIPKCDNDEMIVVQGIIDVCFIEDGKYVIADYKTDNVDNIKELSDKYSLQLQCYAKALNMIDRKGVSELIIYSVKFDDEEPVELSEELKRGE